MNRYFKMLLKAEEIQNHRPVPATDAGGRSIEVCPECCEEQTVYPNPFYLHRCPFCGWEGDYRSLPYIWIPNNTTQLLNILLKVLNAKKLKSPRFTGKFVGCMKEGLKLSRSVEEMVLAFVMKEGYGKTWDPKKQNWARQNSKPSTKQ